MTTSSTRELCRAGSRLVSRAFRARPSGSTSRSSTSQSFERRSPARSSSACYRAAPWCGGRASSRVSSSSDSHRVCASTWTRPCEAVAVRQGSVQWALAGRRVNLEQIDLPSGVDADEITVAVGPDGVRSVVVDGEERETFGRLVGDAVELARARGPAPSLCVRGSCLQGGRAVGSDRRSPLTLPVSTATL